jgi:hypothetical protein
MFFAWEELCIDDNGDASRLRLGRFTLAKKGGVGRGVVVVLLEGGGFVSQRRRWMRLRRERCSGRDLPGTISTVKSPYNRRSLDASFGVGTIRRPSLQRANAERDL